MTLFGPSGGDYSSSSEYLGGVLDTLDGSSGVTFTYLPIVFEDDSQVVRIELKWEDHSVCKYLIEVTILDGGSAMDEVGQ